MSQFAIDPAQLANPQLQQQQAQQDADMTGTDGTSTSQQPSEEELRRLDERDRSVSPPFYYRLDGSDYTCTCSQLAELLASLDPSKPGNNAPILPPALLNHYLEKSGFNSPSPEVTALLGLATQKFVSDVVADAFTYARTRSTSGGTVGRPSNAANRQRERTILTMPDLAHALAEYGIPAGRCAFSSLLIISNRLTLCSASVDAEHLTICKWSYMHSFLMCYTHSVSPTMDGFHSIAVDLLLLLSPLEILQLFAFL